MTMLVGRDREVGEIDAALPGSNGGALVLLVGEPGIGKSRLATEAGEIAQRREVRVAWGRCWEAGGAPAFWPWREAFDSLGLSFPDTSSIAAGDPAEARFALFREVASVLGRAASERPILIVLEDLHAADTSALLLLEFLGGHLRGMPVTVIGTYRDLEASLRSDAGAIARVARSARVFQLARLRAAEVATLVRNAIDDADDRLAATVYEATQGNPLFVDEIVREVRARGTGTAMPIPLGVREVIRQRLALISEPARRVLEAGAVIGVEFGASNVGRIIDGASDVLDDTARSGLVTAHGDRFRFAHALYREALYHDLPRARRQQLHRDAARVLANAGAPIAEVAHHLLEAGPADAISAIAHAIRAAEHALDGFAFEDAIALLLRSRDAIPAIPEEAALRGRVSTALGEARIRSGDHGGRELCVEAARIARAIGDFELLARAGLAYGAVVTMGGVDPVLVQMLEESLARLPEEDSPFRARVMARLAGARQPSPPPERPRDIELAFEAIAMARRCAAGRELLGVLHAASGALYGAADPAVRITISRQQEQLAEELGDTARLLHARVRLAMDHLERADFTSYGQVADAYERLANRVGRAAAPWRVPLMRSMIALARGDLERSLRFQAEARALESEHPRARRAQAYHRIGFLRATERHAELRASLPELRALWLEMPYGRVLADARIASALARIGDDDAVRAILQGLGDDVLAEEINCMALAEAAWITGDARLAARLRSMMAPYRDRWVGYWLDVEIVEAPASRVLAYLTAIAGEWIEAERGFDRALRDVETVGMAAMGARMQFEMGDLMVRAGHEVARAQARIADGRARAAALGLDELVSLIDRRHASPAANAARGPFAMKLEGEYYAISGGDAELRFKASRGMQYLARLVDRPGVEVHVLELAGSADHADRGDAGEMLDPKAFRAYRARLEALREAVEEAEARGDAARAERARGEMEAIAQEITKASALGGRARRGESAIDRARSAVQRRLKDAIDRIAEQDASLGRWLRRSVRTGNSCSFNPDT